MADKHQQNPHRLAGRISELRSTIQSLSPTVLAFHTGAIYTPVDKETGVFHLTVWGQDVTLTFPDLIAYDSASSKELGPDTQALLLYYFVTSDGVPESGIWISFAELPGGRFYNRAYQGYTGRELVKVFQSDTHRFIQAAERIGGRRVEIGDAAFSFQALPLVSLLVVFWQGDEDFPSSIQILFDSSASHYLPTDVYAGLGARLTGRLIKAASSTTAS